LTNDNATVHLSDAATSEDASGSLDHSVLCMSALASVQAGHAVSFHLHHTAGSAAADADKPLLLSERDGVGLSVGDNISMDSDDVIFYSFQGQSVTFIYDDDDDLLSFLHSYCQSVQYSLTTYSCFTHRKLCTSTWHMSTVFTDFQEARTQLPILTFAPTLPLMDVMCQQLQNSVPSFPVSN